MSVDWEAGAEPPYAQAVSNARVVALEIVAFIKTIKVNLRKSSELESVKNVSDFWYMCKKN